MFQKNWMKLQIYISDYENSHSVKMHVFDNIRNTKKIDWIIWYLSKKNLYSHNFVQEFILMYAITLYSHCRVVVKKLKSEIPSACILLTKLKDVTLPKKCIKFQF